VPNLNQMYVVRIGDRYYRDTRKEAGYGGFSDIFTSSTVPRMATMYTNEKDAKAWADEFLGADSAYTVEAIDA
jgi:hypothetical protein